MVNYCVCGGCTNSNLSGHRVHRFPNKKKDGAIFRAWVRFVQVKRRDFTSASASKNAVVCSIHFTPEDYNPGDMMEVNMGYRSKNQVRLIAGAVPSVHAASSSAAGGIRHGSVRDAARRKRELCTDLGDIASNEREAASSASATVFDDPEQEAFPSLAPQSSVLHFGSQCNLRPSHRSSV
ncbi:THAP domain-containing protein 10-like [Megalobrama amblycephala]|uniref:THAP domain-containing protein 10-like n=1 Tax=Megalobrama amblycephala TaxID=75352 RepID=UPI00201404F1|nr:THAP domain-containing protein 10-like [Megalobrama amblycephala]